MIAARRVRPGTTIQTRWPTYGTTGASITMSGLAVTDIEWFKGSVATARASDNGYTLSDTDGIDIASLTGFHGFQTSLADNSDASFWSAGSEYWCYVGATTVDGVTVYVLADHIEICYDGALIDTTIATLASQTSFTLTSGPAEDDALNGCWAVFHDVASAVQMAVVQILDYTGSTKTVTLAAGATFTAVAGDNISIMPPMPLQPATTGRKLNVSATGLADADMVAISTDTAAADNLEAILDGTGGKVRFLTADGTAAIRLGTTSSNGAAMEVTAANGARSMLLQLGRVTSGTGLTPLTIQTSDTSCASRLDLLECDDDTATGMYLATSSGAKAVEIYQAYASSSEQVALQMLAYDALGASVRFDLSSILSGVELGSIYAPDKVLANNASNNINIGTTSGVKLADAVVHGGTTATLRLGTSSNTTPAFYVTNSNGTATYFEATGGTGGDCPSRPVGFGTQGTGTGVGGVGMATTGAGGTASGESCGWYAAATGATGYKVAGYFTAGQTFCNFGDDVRLAGIFASGGVGTGIGIEARGGTLGGAALTVTGATTLTGAVSATNASNDIRGVALSATGWNSIVVETGFNPTQTLQVIAAAVAGKVTGGPNVPVFKGLDGTTTRIIGVADSDGNRSTATYSV